MEKYWENGFGSTEFVGSVTAVLLEIIEKTIIVL